MNISPEKLGATIAVAAAFVASNPAEAHENPGNNPNQEVTCENDTDPSHDPIYHAYTPQEGRRSDDGPEDIVEDERSPVDGVNDYYETYLMCNGATYAEAYCKSLGARTIVMTSAPLPADEPKPANYNSNWYKCEKTFEPEVMQYVPSESDDEEYSNELEEYCEDLAFTGASYRIRVNGGKNGDAYIKGTALNTEDADCNDIAERQSVVLDVVNRKNGRVTSISEKVKVYGEQKQRFNKQLDLDKFRRGVKSRKLAVRERVTATVKGKKVTYTQYSGSLLQKR